MKSVCLGFSFRYVWMQKFGTIELMESVISITFGTHAKVKEGSDVIMLLPYQERPPRKPKYLLKTSLPWQVLPTQMKYVNKVGHNLFAQLSNCTTNTVWSTNEYGIAKVLFDGYFHYSDPVQKSLLLDSEILRHVFTELFTQIVPKLAIFIPTIQSHKMFCQSLMFLFSFSIFKKVLLG